MAIDSLLMREGNGGDITELQRVVGCLERLAEATPEIMRVDVTIGSSVVVHASVEAEGCRTTRLNVTRFYGEDSHETHRITFWCGAPLDADGYSGCISPHVDDGSLRSRAWLAIQAICNHTVEAADLAVHVAFRRVS